MSAARKIIPVFVPHWGCKNNCVFCNQHRISGAKIPADKNTVITAIENAKKIGIDIAEAEVAFYGGSFTAIPVNEQLELLRAAEEVGSIRISTRPDCINDTILTMLKNNGVKTIELGCQSMDDEVLIQSGRGHTSQDIINAAGLVKAFGFTLILQMMTGLPGDNHKKAVKTAQQLANLNCDGVRIYPTVIIKDTPLYDMWKAGKYKEHTVEEAAKWCVDISSVFKSRNIPIIRLGLNPTDDLSGGDAVGGAYHPAFGEIVYAGEYFIKAERLLDGYKGAKCVVIGVGKGCTSLMVGQKRKNIIELCEKYSIGKIKTVEMSDILRGEISLISVEK